MQPTFRAAQSFVMAGDSNSQFILRFSVIILVMYFNITVKNGIGITAQQSVDLSKNITLQELLDPLMNITDQELSGLLWNITEQESVDPLRNITNQELSDPLWNITDHHSLAHHWDNDNHLCFTSANITNGVILFQGSSNQTCCLQVSASLGTHIQLQIPGRSNSQEPAFFYIEHYGDLENCTNKYVVFNEQIEMCNFMLMHPSILITMQGNVTLYISKVCVTGNVFKCAERDNVQGNENVGQSSDCSNVKGYNDTLSCDPEITHICRIKFPRNCGAILGQREVIFKTCNYSPSQTFSVMMIYPVHTQALNLSDNNIAETEVHAFQSLINLEYLDLHTNELRDLDAGLFLHLSLLKELHLDNNMLQRLPPNVFHTLTSLRYLRLDKNELRELDVDLFLNLCMLKVLQLGNNKLQRLPQNIFQKLTSLEYLYLSSNELRELDVDLFLHLSLLKELWHVNNMLLRLPPKIFHNLTSLEYLYLYFNELRELDADLFLHLSLLKGLWLNYNMLQRLAPHTFHKSTSLEYLVLDFNELRELDVDLFLNLSMLKVLQLGNNKLIRLPPHIFCKLTSLEYLFLNENELRELDSDLFLNLSILNMLHLGNNKLQRLPPNIFHKLTSLESLYLYNNELRELDADLFLHLNMLKLLYLYNNKLQRLSPSIFHNLINLEILYLYNNELRELDANLFLHLSLLKDLQLNHNMLQRLPPTIFHNLTNLEILFLSNNKLNLLPDEILQDLPNLLHLKLSWNHLTEKFGASPRLKYNGSVTLTTGLFHGLKSLQSLQLDNNYLVKLSTGILSGLINLKVFFGNSSQLHLIEANAFQGLWNLIYLKLSNNRLTHLDHGLFKDTVSLSFLKLSHNQLKTIPSIQHLAYLYFFDLTNNSLTWISHNSFSSDSNSLNLFVNPQEVCECYIPNHVNCSAADDRSPYLTCKRLLSTEALVVVMWLLGLNALGGNLFVLFWRQKGTQTNKTNSMLLQNLAASDLLMGIYMLIIASADSYYGDNFPMQSETWRSGITCRIAGAMSITSSEASVFFVTLISIDRFISIRFPFSTCKLGYMTTRLIIIVTWMIAIVLGTVPSVLSGSSFEFYDNSHVCIGLPLALTKNYTVESQHTLLSIQFGDRFETEYVDVFITHEKGLVNGQFFSTAVFLGLNCFCYLIILGCYIEIVRDVRKSSKQAGRSQEMKEQIRLTTKVTAIVATDFCCWFPIIILGILVQTREIELPPSVYAWCVTFVLPINSAINPYLYTVAEIVSSYRKEQSRKVHRQDFHMTRNIFNLETSPNSGH